MLCPQCSRDNPTDARFCMSCAAELTAPDALTPQESSDLGLSPDFVGRRREIGELVSALDDALAGHGRLVMLAGEPGIGKTRIAQEMGAIATQRGSLVLWGRCYEDDGTPPYWPWVQALRSYVRDSTPTR